MTQFFAAVAMGVPTLFMAHRLFEVWRDPLRYDEGRWVRYAVGIFIMEFLIVHSALLTLDVLAETSENAIKWLSLAALTVLYAVYAIVIGLLFRSRQLVLTFLSVLAGRAIAAVFFLSPDDLAWHYRHSVISGALYAATFLLSLLPLPRLGMTEEKVRPLVSGVGSGHWVENPHCAVGAAAIYFLLLGLSEVFVLSWVSV